MGEQRILRVPDDLDGARIDRVVAVLCEVSRAEARRIVDAGGAVLGGEPAVPSRRVAAGDELAVRMPEHEAGPVPAAIEFTEAYRDDHLLVVDKPPHLTVHPGPGTGDLTLVNGLIHRYPELAAMEEQRWGLVHRLDKDTSGLLVVARQPEVHRQLQEELRRRRISRIYLALVRGVPEAPRGTIDAPMGRDTRHPTRMAVRPDGRPARTHYRRLAAWPDASLVEVTLETGRTHQIRVHLSSIGHPVIGDRMYAGRGRQTGPGRQWLHAARLGFVHPVTGESVEVVSPIPPDLQEVLDTLGGPEAGERPSPVSRGRVR